MRHILIVAIFHSGEYHGTTLECHSQYSIGILALGWNYSVITLNRLYTCIGAANVPWKRFGLHCKDINITIELFCFCFVLVSKLLRNCFGIASELLRNYAGSAVEFESSRDSASITSQFRCRCFGTVHDAH